MPNNTNTTFFRKALLDWFRHNKRIFPWRDENASTYELVLSEILLQRTKAETVARYYAVFFSRYPNWESLSKASLKELEKIFKPLGLHKQRAKRVFNIGQEYKARGGILPSNSKELQESNFASLYTFNAFQLFVFNKKAPLLDVNMSRVIRRYFIPKESKDVRSDKELQSFANQIVKSKNCKELNWAILDFASAVCKPRNPHCNVCVLQKKCLSFSQGVLNEPILQIKFENEVKKEGDNRLKVLSLFSGCGGMDLGFEGGFKVPSECINKKLSKSFIDKSLSDGHVKLKSNNFSTVFANDILLSARNTWISYFSKRGYSPEIFHTESIVDLVKMHLSGESVFPKEVDVVTGGFPCQDFSVAGKRNGFNSHKTHNGGYSTSETASIETRGQLYMWMKQVIEITKPKIFIAENVKGLVNLSNVKNIIQSDFAAAGDNGYVVLEPQVLHAANYGIPQSRERVIFIGIKKSALCSAAKKALEQDVIPDDFNPYPKPTHEYTVSGEDLSSPVNLKTIFKNIKEPADATDLSQQHFSKAKYMGSHCQGQIEVDLNGIGPTIRAEHHGNIEFRRLSQINGGKHSAELSKGLIERRLTPRECALIQTFPPDFEFVIKKKHRTKGEFLVSPSQAYKVIGNAVPPLLAYHIAKRLEFIWPKYFK